MHHSSEHMWPAPPQRKQKYHQTHKQQTKGVSRMCLTRPISIKLLRAQPNRRNYDNELQLQRHP
eukprot:806218-Amphidinium_carterae.1